MSAARANLCRFVLVGLIAVAVDWSSYALLYQLAPQIDMLDKGLSYFFGTLVSFAINGKWTFRTQLNKLRLYRHLLVYLLSLTANIFVNHYGLLLFDDAGFPSRLFVLLVSTLSSSTINYVGMKNWVFV